MPDVLDDDPSTFGPALPDLDPNLFPEANEERAALRALNRLAFGARGARGLTVRSVIEDGAVADDAIDNRAAFQATLDAVAAAGGGVALVPAAQGIFRWQGTLTVPAGVILRGLGDRSVVRGLPAEGEPAIRFAPGIHRGGVESLALHGDDSSPPSIGIDLTGALFLRLRNFQVWDFRIGLRMSDGVTPYAGYNHVSDFEVNRCRVGVRAWEHCNQASIREGRIWYCRDGGAGIAIDIDTAHALAVEHIAVENFDLGVRVRGLTRASLRDVYYESFATEDDFTPGIWMDVLPERGSIVRMENSIANVQESHPFGGSLEDAVTNDHISSLHFGAKRHHAAAPERNLLENGDFHRAAGTSIPGWQSLNAPILAEDDQDFVTGGRSYYVTRNGNPNDGLTTTFTVPETTDYLTAMVRYKNVSSGLPFFGLSSGGNTGQFADLLPPADEWRVAAFTVAVDPAAAGIATLHLTADQETEGGAIRVDEAWVVVGATAAPARAHAHRVEILEAPVTVVKRSALKASAEFGPTGLTGLPGLGGAPRGVIGAVLSLRGTATPAGRGGDLLDPSGIGATLPRAVRPFVSDPATGQRWALDLAYDRLQHDRQVVFRGTSFADGLSTFDGSMAVTYQVDVVGWILPS